MSNEKLIAAESEEVVLKVPFPIQMDDTPVKDESGRVRLILSTKRGLPLSSAALHPTLKDSHPGIT
jgi:hypothetical protein